MSAVLPHLEITPQRPDWLAGSPGFEPGNGGIKIHIVHQTYQGAFRKIAEIRPKSHQEVSSRFEMKARAAGQGPIQPGSAPGHGPPQADRRGSTEARQGGPCRIEAGGGDRHAVGPAGCAAYARSWRCSCSTPCSICRVSRASIKW